MITHHRVTYYYPDTIKQHQSMELIRLLVAMITELQGTAD